ncbi:hypothetical protein D6779_05275 [Candidatus Parcubacteria bacterium]|nr:MAG: hypothetical protein D6779_05275 [Candidatus Parcubacteria bacterium]
MVVNAADAFERKRLQALWTELVEHPENLEDTNAALEQIEESGLFTHDQLKRALLSHMREMQRRRMERGDIKGAKAVEGLSAIMEFLIGEKSYEEAIAAHDRSMQMLRWQQQERMKGDK